MAVRPSWPRAPRLALSAIVWALGMQAIVTQSLLIREALVLMFGSELALGVVLFAWLLGVAAGGILGGWLESRLKQPDRVLAGVLALLSVAGCIEIWVFRGARGWLGAQPGELLALSTTVWVAVVLVVPTSTWVGMAFPLACRVEERLRGAPASGAGPLGRVYALESAGSLVGGAAFSFWAVEHLFPIEVALFSAAITMAASALLLWASSRRRTAAGLLGALAFAMAASALLAGEGLHRRLVLRRWRDLSPGYELVAETESRYQNLSIGRLAEQYTLYSDGQVTVDFPDPYTFQPLAHFWMCQHPSPRQVLVLGGGAEGLLSAILQHPVERVDYVEPDPKQIETIQPYLAESDGRALKAPRVHVHYLDGRYFVKTQRHRFDLVIARLPEPTSALRARFYTAEFFGELRRAMRTRSVLCLTAAATPGELSAVSAEYLASLRATLRLVFPHIVVGWGNPAHILASTEPGLITTEPQTLARRYRERGVSSGLFHPVWFQGATDWLDPEKVRRRSEELDRVENAPISTDLHPVIYLQRLVLWDRMTGGRSGNVIEWLRAVRLQHLLAALGALLLMPLLGARLRHGASTGWTRGTVTVSIATTGFATMALSIIWLFSFQNLYGYVYQRIGWIIALFMGGLVAGCALGGRFSRSLSRWLILVDLALATLAFTAPLVLSALEAVQTGPWRLRLVEAAISTLVAVTGVAGGAAFALAGGLQLASLGRAGKAAGGIVGADHAGACAGALLTGLLLVPVYGTAASAFILGAIKLVSAGLLASFRHKA